MASENRKGKATERIVYREFGAADEALERGIPDRSPAQQDLRIQTSRKGRGGKTVTIVSGFQAKPETLQALLKTLKAHCGTGGTAKEDTLEIQGDHREKLLQALLKAGYKAKISGGS
jgi:translation initiation factor 1